MADLDFKMFDADNHYYEATDAFTRHLDPKMHKRAMQWADIDGRQRLLVGGKVNRFIPNPTFDPVARPGALDDYFRGKSPADDIRAAFGELEPISAAYRDRDARLALDGRAGHRGDLPVPDARRRHGGGAVRRPRGRGGDVPRLQPLARRRLGSSRRRAHLRGADDLAARPEGAADEVDWALERDARVVVMRSGPVKDPLGHRTHGHHDHDAVWQKLNDAGILVAFHSGESGYGFMAEAWGRNPEFEAFRYDAFKQLITGHRPIHDTIGGLVCDGLFTRFPNLRVATIESGSDWVGALSRSLRKAFKQRPGSFGGVDPVAQLREHVWVSPYYEDDLAELVEVLGVDHVLFGSDYPHAEGLAEPSDFVADLAGFDDEAIRKIMRDNGMALATPRPT